MSKTIAELIDESGFIMESLGGKMGYSTRSTWWRKRQNPDSWTTTDVKKLASILQKTPREIYSALYFEAQNASIDDMP